MNTTLFKIAVSAPGETPVVPDTGTISGVAEGVKSTILISFAVAILVAAIFATIFLVQSRRKENFRPDIKKTSLGFLLVTILLTGILGPIGRTFDGDVDFSTTGAVTVKAELKEDESITVCGVDTITIKEDLLYGYNLWMSADDLVNDENENAKIVSMEEELVDGTWGYGADSSSKLSSIPATPSKISEVIAEVATDSTKKVKYCAMLSPDTEPGIYSTTIKYKINALGGGGSGGDEGDEGGEGGGSDEDDNYDFIMQEVSTWADELEEGEQYRAKDIRDGKIYYVAKLADGNIWMTQNLDHDIVDTPNFYTYANTDIGHGSTPNTNAKWTGVATLTSDNLDEWATDPNAQFVPQSYDPGKLYWDGELVDIFDEFNDGFVTSGDAHYRVGNYYNWNAAVATSNSEDIGSEIDMDQSICPAGWTLPKTEGDGSLTNLVAEEGVVAGGSDSTIQNSPIYLTFVGGIDNHKTTDWRIRNVGSWSEYLALNGGVASVNTEESRIIITSIPTSYRAVGFPVRCVARKDDSSISSNYIMQEVSTWADELEIGDEVIAEDNRDGKKYYVARLADGNIWMTQNLDHDIVDTPNFYTYENTDIGHGSTPNPNAKWTGVATLTDEDSDRWATDVNANWLPQSYDPGNLYWDGELVDFWAADHDGLAESGNQHHRVGNYYNWTAATAMTESESIGLGIDVNQSICPAGWTLPKTEGDGSFANLAALSDAVIFGSPQSTVQDSPIYLVFGGTFFFGTDSHTGSRIWNMGGWANYWTSASDSTEYDDAHIYLVNSEDAGVLSGRLIRKTGVPIRCVARKDDSSISSNYIMQEVSTWADELEIGDEVIAEDNRDGKKYYVARLADGNIWMTQNLDHDIVDTPNFYTYENTDIGHGSTPNTNAKWTGAATLTSDNLDEWATDPNDVPFIPQSYDPGNLYWDGELIDFAQIFNDGFVTSGDAHYRVGNYYNWNAAVATSNSEDIGSEIDMDQSICPAGWTLPKTEGDGSLTNLVAEEGVVAGGPDSTIQNSPIYLTFVGQIDNWQTTSWTVRNVGGFAFYWTSKIGQSTSDFVAYAATTNSEDVIPLTAGKNKRINGFSIRCVAR